MVSDSEVTVTQVSADWPPDGAYDFDPQYYYEFKPVGITPMDGFIIYPGGLVDVRAYAVVARGLQRPASLWRLFPCRIALASSDPSVQMRS